MSRTGLGTISGMPSIRPRSNGRSVGGPARPSNPGSAGRSGADALPPDGPAGLRGSRIVFRGGAMTALPTEPCYSLAWDSAHFGFAVARARGDILTSTLATDIDAWCRRTRTRCLYFQARAEDADTSRVADFAGFRPVDLRVVFAQRLGPADPEGAGRDGGALRMGTGEDSKSLEDIAAHSYRLSRFYFDGGFPMERVDALYATWIRQSLTGFAAAVLVTGPVGKPLGFISCHLPGEGEPARIGLVGVAEEAQGRGVGRALLAGALEWFRQAGITRVEVATQGRNTEAQRLYQRAGFVTDHVRTWYHKWYQ